MNKSKEFWTKKITHNDLNNIFISPRNPRFTELRNIRSDLCNIIRQDVKSIKQEEVALKLFQREGNLKKLVELMKSISINNFDGSSDLIFVEVVQGEESEYVVAEGNRRILCLKVLNGLINIPEMEFFIKHNNPYQNVDKNDYFDQRNKFEKEIIYNYNKFKNLVLDSKDRFLANKKEEYLSPTITNSNDYLWKRLHAKHVNGQAVGLKNWSRGQYFLNLLNYFNENGLDLNEQEKNVYEIRLQKTFAKIKIDYKHAQLVYKIAQSDTNDYNLIKDFITNNPVSGLQESFWNKILRLIISEIYGCEWEEIKNKFYEIDYSKKNCKLTVKSFFKNDFLKFVKKWFLKKLFTTRTDFKKHEEFNFFLDELTGLLRTEIPEIFPTFSKQNNEILKSIDYLSTELTRVFKKIFNEVVQKWTLIAKTQTLLDQLKHNGKMNGKYLHASASTIRTILEFLIFFNLACMNDLELNKLKLKPRKMKQKDIIINLNKEEYNTTSLLQNFKTDKKNKLSDFPERSKVFCVLVKEAKIGEEIWNLWTKRYILNKIIHRLYYKDVETNRYLTKSLKAIIDFFNGLDLSKFNNLILEFEKLTKE